MHALSKFDAYDKFLNIGTVTYLPLCYITEKKRIFFQIFCYTVLQLCNTPGPLLLCFAPIFRGRQVWTARGQVWYVCSWIAQSCCCNVRNVAWCHVEVSIDVPKRHHLDVQYPHTMTDPGF